MMVHAMLNTNCITYNINGTRALPVRPPPSRHTKNEANPIAAYKIVQTGAKSQLGGRNDGWTRDSNHGSDSSLEKKNPFIKPAITGTRTATTATTIYFIFMFELMLLKQ